MSSNVDPIYILMVGEGSERRPVGYTPYQWKADKIIETRNHYARIVGGEEWDYDEVDLFDGDPGEIPSLSMWQVTVRRPHGFKVSDWNPYPIDVVPDPISSNETLLAREPERLVMSVIAFYAEEAEIKARKRAKVMIDNNLW